MSPLVRSISAAPLGIDAMAHLWPKSQSACLSTFALTLAVLWREEEQGPSSLSVPILAITHMVLRSDLFLEKPPWRIPITDNLSHVQGLLWHYCPEIWRRWVWPLTLMDSGLSSDIAEIILNAKASSKLCLYALKCSLFTSGCTKHRVDPVHCPDGSKYPQTPEG